MTLTPYHEVEDYAKLAALTESMERDGWVGYPLVAWDDNLITGAHRHAAYVAAYGDDANVPVVQIADLAALVGEDFLALCEEEGCDGIDSAALVYVLDRCITDQQRNDYGIDVH